MAAAYLRLPADMARCRDFRLLGLKREDVSMIFVLDVVILDLHGAIISILISHNSRKPQF